MRFLVPHLELFAYLLDVDIVLRLLIGSQYPPNSLFHLVRDTPDFHARSLFELFEAGIELPDDRVHLCALRPAETEVRREPPGDRPDLLDR